MVILFISLFSFAAQSVATGFRVSILPPFSEEAASFLFFAPFVIPQSQILVVPVLPDRPPSSNHAKHRWKSAKLGFRTLHGCGRVWPFEILPEFVQERQSRPGMTASSRERCFWFLFFWGENGSPRGRQKKVPSCLV